MWPKFSLYTVLGPGPARNSPKASALPGHIRTAGDYEILQLLREQFWGGL